MSVGLTARELLAGMKERGASTLEVGNYTPIVLLEMSPELKRLVAVWPNVMADGPRDPQPDQPVPDGLPLLARTDWLWARLEPDPIPDWIRLAGLPDAPHVRRLCRQAIDNRMVLPDGTLANPIRAYLNKLVMTAVEPPDAGARRREEERRRREEERRRRAPGGDDQPGGEPE